MDRECAVCYGENGPFQKLCCGHTFCTGCVKNWYLKGVNGSSCPMCRRTMYFKGFHKVREDWNEEAYDNRCAEIMSEAFDTTIGDALEMAETFPRMRRRILREAIRDLIDVERTFRYLKNADLTAEDIEYVLLDTGDYYSDRHMDRVQFLDEPPKRPVSRYPKNARGGSRSGKRARARQDAWSTFTLIIDF